MQEPPRNIIDAAVESLEHFRRRVGMYIGAADVGRAEAFLNGLSLGLAAAGIGFVEDAWWKAQADRGWEKAPFGPIAQMEAKGMDASAIISELVEIEIQMLRRYTVYGE
jgi:hypothetical protein